MKRVCDHSWFLSLGNFKSLSPTLPEAWEQGSQRRLSRSAPFVPVVAADGKYWGSKEGQSRRKSRMWRVEVGPRWPSSPGATRVQNRRWQSPECCQRARMNRGDLFLSRCALPEQGVQREWPSTITNGQKLVLICQKKIRRLPRTICSLQRILCRNRKRSKSTPDAEVVRCLLKALQNSQDAAVNCVL